MNLSCTMALAAERYPDAEALVDRGVGRTYGELQGRINRIAHALVKRGIGRGDHVVLSLKNSEVHVAVYWACQIVGAVATPVNWRYAPGEVEFVVSDAEAVAVLFEEASSASILAARPALAGVRDWIFVGAAAPPDCVPFEHLDSGGPDPGQPAAEVTDADISIMLYTSGTTGRPKGVPRTLKIVLNKGADAPLESALELERKSYAWLRSTEDYAEGVTSFLEKRKPVYKGR